MTLGEVLSKERETILERPTVPEIPPEVKEHLEAVPGEELILPKPITDDGGGVILDNVAPQQITVILPLTANQLSQALKMKVVYSLRWLAEWVKRLVKIVGGKFTYKLKTEN